MTPRQIEITIDALHLEGFPPQQRWRIAAALEQALGHLCATQGVPLALQQARTSVPVPGGTFQVAPGASAAAIGAQIAQAVYTHLTQGSTV